MLTFLKIIAGFVATAVIVLGGSLLLGMAKQAIFGPGTLAHVEYAEKHPMEEGMAIFAGLFVVLMIYVYLTV